MAQMLLLLLLQRMPSCFLLLLLLHATTDSDAKVSNEQANWQLQQCLTTRTVGWGTHE
jgi:hypothetical protein